MATEFEAMVARTPADNRYARERQERFIGGIIDDVEQTSLALSLGEVHRMSTYKEVLRLSNTKPAAYFINGTTGAGDAPHGSSNNDDTNQLAKDSGLKQTTTLDWDYLTIVPDEIAVQVPMPDAWRDDSDITWEEIRSALRSAFAMAIDSAIFFGRSLTSHPIPSTFGDGIVPDTIAAGHFEVEGVGVDLADDYALFLQGLEGRGFRTSATLVDMAEPWRLRRLRDGNDVPLYQNLGEGDKSAIYGRPLREVENDIWRPTDVTALGGDFSNLKIGVRQGMTFDMSNTAVIHDADGNVVYNAWQQDGMVLRAVMRIGYKVVDPFRYRTGAREWPFHCLLPENYSS